MMAYIVWSVSPEIIDGFYYFRWYGVSWVLGLLLAQWLMNRMNAAEGSPIKNPDTLTLYLMVGAVVGARLGHILFYDPIYYFQNPVEILPIKLHPEFQFIGLLGLASHGGVLGTLLALYLYNKKYKVGYAWLLDRLVIAGSALGALIRLGNLMNSEIIGTPSTLPWAFKFTRVDLVPRHPTQLYEAIFYFAACAGLYLLWKSGKFNQRPGFIFGCGITILFAQRFCIEFLKESQAGFEENLMLNMGQVLSIPMIVVGIIAIVYSSENKEPTAM